MRLDMATATAALLLTLPALAQSPKPKTAPAEHPTDLPVTHVSLYKNGIGFFEHTGRVTGNAAVTLSFTSSQLNDVLQSLTAIDLNGGRISGAGYNSTTPLDQQLKSLAIGLNEKTTFSGLYTALRGTRVSITGSGAPFNGRIVDIEMHKTGPGKETTGMLEGRFLTVASDSGEIRIFQVTPTLTVRLLDTSTHTSLNQYLQLLDANRSQSLRHLTIDDLGTGPRELRVSYISEVPIWKSTYRILLTTPATPSPAQTATLQGWSVVDNTTGTDWINVQLSLIAGAPQSFIQPLSQPIYSRRPEIPIAQQAQLTPQTFDSSMDKNSFVAGVAGGTGSGVISADDLQKLSLEGRDAKQPTRVLHGEAIRSDGANLSSSNSAFNPGQVSFGAAAGSYSMSAAPALSYEQAANQSIAANTSTTAFDDFFAYNLADPITIHQNESALVPILQTKVPAESVTLVSSNGFATQQPLRALWLTNSSNLTLDRGSFSLLENGAFSGEGLLDPIHPGEKRLLSYAADQAIHVTMDGNNTNSHVVRITAARGVITLHNSEAHQVTYVVHNSATTTRTVVLEQPFVRNFVLDSATPTNTDPKPDETTPTVYRFRINVPSGDTVRLHTGAHRNGTSAYQLTNSNDNQLTYILNQTGNNPTLTAALQPILDARRKVADTQIAVDETTEKLTALREDEERQRQNITALATADKASRDRFVKELNTTEDNLTTTQTEYTNRQQTLTTAKADLAQKIETLTLDESL